MSLQLQLGYTSVSADCTTVVMTDTTGAYSVSTPGGYGTPNPARSSLYLLFLCNLRLNSGRQAIPVPAYNYNTGSTWTLTINQDGWYEMFAFATVIYSSGTTYSLGYITYDSVSNAFYVSQQNSNTGNAVSNTTWWLPTVNVQDFINAINIGQANTYTVTYNDVELCRSVKCKALSLYYAALQDQANAPENENSIQLHEKIRLRVESAEVARALELYTDAQNFVDDLTHLCVKCNCM